jgi:hypothetical protein
MFLFLYPFKHSLMGCKVFDCYCVFIEILNEKDIKDTLSCYFILVIANKKSLDMRLFY